MEMRTANIFWTDNLETFDHIRIDFTKENLESLIEYIKRFNELRNQFDALEQMKFVGWGGEVFNDEKETESFCCSDYSESEIVVRFNEAKFNLINRHSDDEVSTEFFSLMYFENMLSKFEATDVSTVTVYVRGGNVVDVRCDSKDVIVEVLDYDNATYSDEYSIETYDFSDGSCIRG
ncbi:MAG: hypothetical protein BWY74_00320 [Firmicutes bacterium ADurb.Bin419]|nr:MAG: hypothetical protein BWY74_00320 [Firmicutes bacterium ADurb.Bin419]